MRQFQIPVHRSATSVEVCLPAYLKEICEILAHIKHGCFLSHPFLFIPTFHVVQSELVKIKRDLLSTDSESFNVEAGGESGVSHHNDLLSGHPGRLFPQH
jgi:hypothetical protein